jgi:hypothetical protein
MATKKKKGKLTSGRTSRRKPPTAKKKERSVSIRGRRPIGETA